MKSVASKDMPTKTELHKTKESTLEKLCKLDLSCRGEEYEEYNSWYGNNN